MTITSPREERQDFSSAEEVEVAPVKTPARVEAEGRTDDEGQEGGPGRRSAGLNEQAQEALKLVTGMLDLMGEKAEAFLSESEPDAIHIDIKGDGSGILIGRHGQTLDAH